MRERHRKVLVIAVCAVLLGAALGVGGWLGWPRGAGSTATAATITEPGSTTSGSASSTPSGPAKPVAGQERVQLGPAQAGAGASPSARPVTKARAVRKVSTKKGAAMGPFAGAGTALGDSGVSWYYNWAATPQSIPAPAGVAYAPMIWGPAAVTSATLAAAKAAGDTLLGFNEPDMAGQSNMSVDQALSLWPRLEATGMRLGSPAPAYGAATDGSWFDQFMKGAQSKGYRVDFIALHWYGSDFSTPNAVSQLRSYIQAVWERWHKPIWLTEYALIKFGATSTYPTPAEQASFVTASTAMLNSLSYLERYSWFIFSPPTSGPSGTSLYTADGTPTTVGDAYRAA